MKTISLATAALLVAALERCSNSLAWYSKNGEGNSPESPDPDDAEGVSQAEAALAQYKAEIEAQAPRSCEDRTHLLREWRVIYRECESDDPLEAFGPDDNRVMKFMAEDAEHAIEQFVDARDGEEVIVGVLRDNGFCLLPDTEDNVVMNPAVRGAWITVRNLAVHLVNREDDLSIHVCGFGREADDTRESLECGFAIAAIDAFVDHEDTVEAIRDHASVLMQPHILAHLAELERDGDQTGLAGRAREALAEQLD